MVHVNDEDDNSDAIQQVRDLFNQEVRLNGDLYDAIDIDRVNQDDWTVERFLRQQKNDIEKGYQMLIDAMRWRKSFGVNHIKTTDFPKEYFETGEAHLHVKDQNGVFTVYLRVKLHRKISELSPLSQKFLVYLFEKCEAEGRKSGKG